MRNRLALLNNMEVASSDLRRMSLFTEDFVRNETSNYLTGYFALMYGFRKESSNKEWKLRKNVSDLNSHYLDRLSSLEVKNGKLKDDDLTVMTSFMQLNAAFDKLLDSYDEGTPPIIMTLLISTSVLIGILIGFLNGFNNKNNYLAPIIFVIMVTLCIQAIRDMDNPFDGSIQSNLSFFKST